MTSPKTAAEFVKRLKQLSSPEEAQKLSRYFKTGKAEYGAGDKFVGVRMGQLFALAKESIEMLPSELEKLLENPIHEVRAGALSIMDKQARRKKTTPERRIRTKAILGWIRRTSARTKREFQEPRTKNQEQRTKSLCV
jgi:DNA alkylation repair enzyme